MVLGLIVLGILSLILVTGILLLLRESDNVEVKTFNGRRRV